MWIRQPNHQPVGRVVVGAVSVAVVAVVVGSEVEEEVEEDFRMVAGHPNDGRSHRTGVTRVVEEVEVSGEKEDLEEVNAGVVEDTEEVTGEEGEDEEVPHHQQEGMTDNQKSIVVTGPALPLTEDRHHQETTAEMAEEMQHQHPELTRLVASMSASSSACPHRTDHCLTLRSRTFSVPC